MQSLGRKGLAFMLTLGALLLGACGHVSGPPSLVAARSDGPTMDPQSLAFDPRKDSAACHGDKPSERLAFPSEAEAIAATGRAIRQSQKLRVGAASFRDKPADHYEVDSIIHRYVGRYSTAPVDLVSFVLWEGSGWILIDRSTGDTAYVADFPHVSPDGQAFASASEDEAYNFHGIEVVDYRNGHFTHHEIVASYPCDLVWEDPSAFSVKILTGRFDSGPSAWKTVRVIRDGKGWELLPP